MKSIYIGVCKTRDDERFKESFRNLTDSLCNKFSICQMVVKNTFLPDAQNQITRNFLQSDYDYLLLLDDDQWGHTPEMVDCLIEANTYVATIKTYLRNYPYSCALFRYVTKQLAIPIEGESGYVECDLTGFPMTLIRKDTFDFLEYPYFRPYDAIGRTWNSDVDFFMRLAEKGIKPIGCFQHILNHDKVTAENVLQLRHEDRLTGNNLAWWRLQKAIAEGSFKFQDLELAK